MTDADCAHLPILQYLSNPPFTAFSQNKLSDRISQHDDERERAETTTTNSKIVQFPERIDNAISPWPRSVFTDVNTSILRLLVPLPFGYGHLVPVMEQRYLFPVGNRRHTTRRVIIIIIIKIVGSRRCRLATSNDGNQVDAITRDSSCQRRRPEEEEEEEVHLHHRHRRHPPLYIMRLLN